MDALFLFRGRRRSSAMLPHCRHSRWVAVWGIGIAFASNIDVLSGGLKGDVIYWKGYLFC